MTVHMPDPAKGRPPFIQNSGDGVVVRAPVGVDAVLDLRHRQFAIIDLAAWFTTGNQTNAKGNFRTRIEVAGPDTVQHSRVQVIISPVRINIGSREKGADHGGPVCGGFTEQVVNEGILCMPERDMRQP